MFLTSDIWNRYHSTVLFGVGHMRPVKVLIAPQSLPLRAYKPFETIYLNVTLLWLCKIRRLYKAMGSIFSSAPEFQN